MDSRPSSNWQRRFTENLRNVQAFLEPFLVTVRPWAARAAAALRWLLISRPAPIGPWPRTRVGLIWTARGIGTLAACLVALQMNFLWLFGSSPSLSSIANPDLAVASEVWSSDSVLLGRYWVEDRIPVTRDEIPRSLVDALVATEDARFFQHSGVDLVAPFAILWSAAKGDARGGSTLTQQLAKNLYNTRRATSKGLLGLIPGVRQLVWKTKEWLTALQLELFHSKDEILVLYLNTVSFGGATHGIQAATHFFFDKEASDLAPEEAALLVGMLKAPGAYNPLKRPEKARERRNVVLAQLARYGHLPKSVTDSLAQLPLALRPRQASPADGPAPWYRVALASWLREWCRQNGYDLNTDGLVIRTTLDSRLQELADSSVSTWMRELNRRFDSHWGAQNPWRYTDGREIPRYLDSLALGTGKARTMLAQGEDSAAILDELKVKKRRRIYSWKQGRVVDSLLTVQDSIRIARRLLHAGFVVVDPSSGAIRAWVGGLNHTQFPFDHVGLAKRQPGSTFKPFTYVAALLQGWSPCDKLVDRPVTINYVENGEKKTWSPHNSDWTNTNDSMTLRHAMGRSINSVTAQLTMKVGPPSVARIARELGIKSHLDTVPSIGLGPNPVTLLELVTAYLPFQNGGKAYAPWFVERIEDHSGKVLAVFRPAPRQVLPPDIAWYMLHMLKGGIEEPLGTSQNLWSFDLFKNGGEMGGKTGTSSDHADGWFVGVTPQLVLAAWTGADDPSVHFRSGELGEGSKTALPIVGKFLEAAYRRRDLGLAPGKFPKAPAGLPRSKWYCPTPWDRYRDTTAVDSLADSAATATTPTKAPVIF